MSSEDKQREVIERIRHCCVKGGVSAEVMGAICHSVREVLDQDASASSSCAATLTAYVDELERCAEFLKRERDQLIEALRRVYRRTSNDSEVQQIVKDTLKSMT